MLKKYKHPQLVNPNNTRMLASKTDGFSGAEIEQVVISALFDAFDANSHLQLQHILKSIEFTVPLSKTMVEDIEHLRNWAKYRARLRRFSLLLAKSVYLPQIYWDKPKEIIQCLTERTICLKIIKLLLTG